MKGHRSVPGHLASPQLGPGPAAPHLPSDTYDPHLLLLTPQKSTCSTPVPRRHSMHLQALPSSPSVKGQSE